ncbi:unnamed protein product [Phytophthora fragariaefolia]|uniref:Unnamed protein product n=1 Tax=Phytophthora fragariaefolia TaxID=1490495 RepID=A0A9W7CVX7_9STRA|nr:unnamed protein product [Phytophthora fragariaefolia]
METRQSGSEPMEIDAVEASQRQQWSSSRRARVVVLKMNYAFDCILGMPWLARYQPPIDWLARSVKRRQDFDVSEVFTHLLVAPRDWPHVTVVDGASTTHVVRRASDSPLCTTCSVLLTGEDEDEHARRRAPERQTRAYPRETRMQNGAVEQRLPHENDAVEQGLPQINEAVEQRLRYGNEAVGHGLPEISEAVEQGLPHATEGGSRMTKSRLSHALHRSREPPRDAKSITSLPGRSWKNFQRDLKAGDIEQVCLITDAESVPRVINSIELSDATSRPKSAEPKSALEKRFAAQSWEALKASGNPVYETAREFADVFPDKIPAVLPADRGVHHEIDLAPGAKYCVTRQWPLPRDQVKAIDECFEGRRQAGHVRESTSPHSSSTFCVKNATGGWRIVHTFNKLNDATIPAQTPIPRKDMVLDSMSGNVDFSAIDLTDGFYQILMRKSDIPLTAVSTPSGMLWECLVMPPGLKNAPATFNCMVSHRPDYDPCIVLGRQAIDDEDESDDHYAVCAASGITLKSASPEMDLRDEIIAAYADDADFANLLALCYNFDRSDAPRVVIPNDDDLRALDSQVVRTCEACQQVKPSKSLQAPLHPLPIATDAWRPVSMGFGFGLPPDADGQNGASVFVARFTKMVHLTPVSDTVTAAETAAHFVDCVFRHHGLPESIVSDRDPWFTSAFWTALFQLPETDGQTERVNRVLEYVLGSYATSFKSWSKFIPLAEFALNNAEHVSTGIAPFFANNARHPRGPALPAVGHPTVFDASTLGGNDDADDDKNGVDDIVRCGDHDPEALNAVTRSKSNQALAAPSSPTSPLAAWTARTLIDPGNTGTPIAANYTPKPPARQVDNAAVSAFVQRREPITRFVRDALQDAVDKQKENAEKPGRKNIAAFTIGEQGLLSTDSIRSSAYYPATVPSAMDLPASTPERRVNDPPDAPPAAPRRHVTPTPKSAPVSPDLTSAPLQAPYPPVRPESSPSQPPPKRPAHDSTQL